MRWLLIGIVWLYFLVLLVGPILYMASQSFSEGLAAFWTEISRPEALHGFTLTAEITLIVLVLNLIFGTMTALVLARQKFWGQSLVSGVIDLPFAVSPVIAGFMLILLFGPDTVLGTFFGQAQIKVLFALPAMILATLFVTFPFMVRELTPVDWSMEPPSPWRARSANSEPSSWSRGIFCCSRRPPHCTFIKVTSISTMWRQTPSH
jgi:sulfate transport system permease protein